MVTQIKVSYVTEYCWCGAPVYVPKEISRIHKEEGGAIHCWQKHSAVIAGKTQVQKLQEEKARLEHQRNTERQYRKNAEAHAKREKTRRKNMEQRTAAGTCPHCNRTFKQLARHMKCKHPEKVN